MKAFNTLAATLAVCLVIAGDGAQGQGGFFSNIGNLFRPSRQSQNARPAFRPNQQPPQQQQQQFNRQQPQQQAFQPQPQQQQFRQPQQPQQQQQFRNPQPTFRQPQQQQQQSTFRRPAQQQTVNRPQQQVFNRPQQSQAVRQNQQSVRLNTNSVNNNQQQQANSCPALPREDTNDREGSPNVPGTRCPDGLAPAFQYRGMNVILTWLNTSHPAWNDGCKTFTGIQAENYCRAQGGHAASLDTNEAAEQYMKQSAVYAQRYYWTGGRLNHRCGVLQWPSGKSEGWVKGQRFWSHTGGSSSKGPQPDNRHELEDGHPGEPEKCLGVLNNFYADGIKWHDVACHHKKPTICEVPINRG